MVPLPRPGGLPIVLAPVADARRLGVEHEYAVWSDGERADFRQLLPGVAGGLRCLDPGDPRVRTLPSGTHLTADGREAELATPPVPWEAGAPERLDRLLAAERSELLSALGETGVASALTGFSTHVNVSVPDEVLLRIGRLFVEHVALAAIAVGEPRSSSGLLVRPRRGRLEIGGEYAEGEHLVALLTFVVAAVSQLLAGSEPTGGVTPVVEASREKFGWFLPPAGPVGDLLARPDLARATLEQAWQWARPGAVGAGVDPGPVDGLVAGAPLRLERDEPPGSCSVDPDATPPIRGPDTAPRTLGTGVRAETEWLTWRHAVWCCFEGEREVRAVVPTEQEEEFLGRLGAGEYDAVLGRLLARRGPTRRLLVHAQITGAAWWHEVRPGALVPAERGLAGAVPRVSSRRAARDHRAGGRWSRPVSSRRG